MVFLQYVATAAIFRRKRPFSYNKKYAKHIKNRWCYLLTIDGNFAVCYT